MRVAGSPFDPVATAISAIENASSIPVSQGELAGLLRTGKGEPSHLRALFGDVDLYTLLRLARRFDIDGETLARAYRIARRDTAAANADLEEFAAQFDS